MSIHACVQCATEEDLLAAAVPFLRDGLERRDRCLYIVADQKGPHLVSALERTGVAVDQHVLTGGFSLVEAEGSYLAGGVFDADMMIAWWRDQLDRALRDGFAGLRVVGHAATIQKAHSGGDRLAEYEAKLDRLMRDRSGSVLCVYETSQPAALFREAIAIHTQVMVGGLLCRNPHHVKPDDYLASDRPNREVKVILDNLWRAQLAENDRVRHAHAAIQAREAERRAIARELHDDLGQILAAIQMSLGALIDAGSPPSTDALREIEAHVGEATEAVRSLALDLRPAALDDLGLAAALRSTVRRQARRGRLELGLDLTSIDGATMSRSLETTCFRLVNEAVENVVRHAQAHRLEVQVRAGIGTIDILVRDDGGGFDVAAARQRGGLGLLGMAERAELAGAELTIESSVGAGTTVRVAVPLEQAVPP